VTGPADWAAVDAYFEAVLHPADPALDAILATSAAAGVPLHDVAPNQGRLLTLLVRMCGARRILEIGTLGGYSAVFLARGLPPDGLVVTLERSAAYAAVARQNLARAGADGMVELRVGPAAGSLAALADEGVAPFDLVFIDADKQSNPLYLERSLALSAPGTVIVADNVVRGGAAARPEDPDPRVQGIRRFAELVGADPRLEATAIQTVGTKGHDGFLLARVRAGACCAGTPPPG
jgi:predicted O-methyltransferase YrrM